MVARNIALEPAGSELIRGFRATGRLLLRGPLGLAGRVGGVYSVVYLGALSRLIREYLGGASFFLCSGDINIHSSGPNSSSSLLRSRDDDGLAGMLVKTPSLLLGVVGADTEESLPVRGRCGVNSPPKLRTNDGEGLSADPLGANGSSSVSPGSSSISSSSPSEGGLSTRS